MADEREWGDGPPAEGVPEVPAVPAEIDITDGAVEAAAPWEADSGDGEAAGDGEPAAAAAQPRDDDPAHDADAADADVYGAAGAADGTADGTADGADGADETPPLRRILESILLVVDEPVPEVNLAQVLETPRAVVLGALEDLAAEYLRDGRGFELRQVAGGWRLYTAPDCAPYVERFVLDGQQARLTQAALETLAVIAYRQPVTRQTVAAIRGVNVDGVVRTLLGRGLIAEAGEEGPGGAHLYVTTPYFLERLGLRSVDELPNLAPLLPVNIDDLTDHA